MNRKQIFEESVEVWVTSEYAPGGEMWFQGPHELAKGLITQPAIGWTVPEAMDITTLVIEPEHTYQKILGIGTSVEETTVHNLSKMSTFLRKCIWSQLTDSVHGIGLNLFRITLGTSDFTAQVFYTYDDIIEGETDFELKQFSIQKDIDLSIIDALRELLAISPNVLLFASPWSPPAWMKTNGSLKRGQLKEGKEYTTALAKYYRLAIQAYAEQGIPIYAMTLQNEPLLETDYPSCYMSPERQKELALELKRELSEHSLDTKIWIFDHNFSDVWSYVTPILNDKEGYAAVDGIALHDYEGEPSAMYEIHAAYPDQPIFLTERSVWGTRGADRIAQYFRNYASSYNAWVTMLDSQIGTHQWLGIPGPTLLIQDAAETDRYWQTPELCLLGQFARFIERGAVRIGSTYGSADTVTNVVFRNPDGCYIAVVINQTDSEQKYRVLSGGNQFLAALPAKSVGTYRWKNK